MLRINAIELVVLELSLRPVEGALGVFDRRPVVLVRVVTDAIEGWGECAALAESAGPDPFAEAIEHRLGALGIPRLLAAASARGGEIDAGAMSRLFSTSSEDRMVAATLEMALLDTELRSAGGSLADRLGTAGDPVEVGGLVGIPADRRIDTLIASVSAVLESGSRRVRVKIAPGWDVQPLRSVRTRFPELALQADANGAYRLSAGGADEADPRSARRLRELDDLGLVCVEQPLPAPDLAAHVELRELLDTPIALDESLASPRHVEQALRYGACDIACLKPGRLGGLFAARQAVESCRTAGVAAFVGGFFETGLARGANAALAGLPGFTLPGDLSEPSGYLNSDPFGYPRVQRGIVTPPSEPGVGALPDPDRLAACTVRSRLFVAG